MIPSEIMNVAERIWSVIRRMETSCLMIFIILFSGDFAYFVAECLNGVDIEDGIYILYDNGKTLKSHTGINVLLDQVGVVALVRRC